MNITANVERDREDALNEVAVLILRILPGGEMRIAEYTSTDDLLASDNLEGACMAFLDYSCLREDCLNAIHALRNVNKGIDIFIMSSDTQSTIGGLIIHSGNYLVKQFSEESVRWEFKRLGAPKGVSSTGSPAEEGKIPTGSPAEEGKISAGSPAEEGNILSGSSAKGEKGRKKRKGIGVRCFGSFEAFLDGVPIHFRYQKTKELLAYLIDRRGAMCTNRELETYLWAENADPGKRHYAYLQKIKEELIHIFNEAGYNALLIRRRGNIAINPDLVDCDYYRYLNGSRASGDQFRGEYMRQYSWGEFTLGYLLTKEGARGVD